MNGLLNNAFLYVYFVQLCIIADCGELKEGDDWGIAPMDGSGDTHPDFPEDSDIDLKDVSMFFPHLLTFYSLPFQHIWEF